MEGKGPRFIFYQPDILCLEEAIVPVRVRERLERLGHMSEVHVPYIIFAPAGIGVSCGRIALAHCEEAIMLVVKHKSESRLNDQIPFDLSEIVIERPLKLEVMILRSPAILMSALERLMLDDKLTQALSIPFVASERFDCETFIDLKLTNTSHQRLKNPSNKLFNSRSRQNIKHFIRKK